MVKWPDCILSKINGRECFFFSFFFYQIRIIERTCFTLNFVNRPFDAKNPYLSKMVVNRELHEAGDRSCMHMEFDIDGSKIRYDAGDHLAVYPQNSIELVGKLGTLLGKDLDVVFTLTNTDGNLSKLDCHFFILFFKRAQKCLEKNYLQKT